MQDNDILELADCPDSGPELDAVLRLSKLAKATVGFMPDSAFRDRAQRGTLIVALKDHHVFGYVMYDLPRDEVRIRQLVVEPAARGQHIASRLVDRLVERHENRRGIVLECRRDFAVSEVWPKLHFVPVEERPGRNDQGLPLTIWYRDFGHPTLFSVIDDNTRPIAALDANIVIDLADHAATSSERLTAEWLQNSVQLAVTDEVFVELDQQSDSQLRSRHRRCAANFRHLHCDASNWEPLFRELQAEVAHEGSFEADLRHAARAAAAGARWLVTRDGRFERACSGIVKSVADLGVVSPGGLLVAIDSIVRGDTYRPTDLAGSSLQLRVLEPSEFENAAQTFVNQREGERLSHLRHLLDQVAAEAPLQSVRVLADDDQLLGLIVSRATAVLELPLCRVHRGKAQSTIARQLLAIARSEGANQGAAGVRLADPHCGEWIRRAATTEGYVSAGSGLTAMPIPGLGSRAQLIERVDAAINKLPSEAVPAQARLIAHDDRATVAAEQFFHPWRLTGADIPTFVVSIESAWAGELFDAEIARGALFPRSSSLALQREHVYYRSPIAAGGIAAPARILWYVKAAAPNRSGLRAVSTLRDVVVGEPHKMYRRFAHLGVFSEEQVLTASDGSRVMAMRFSDTSMLPRPVSLNDYRDAMRAHGVGVSLQGPQRLPEHVFDNLATLCT